MAANQALVSKLYRGVIEDVINGVREAFLDEGIDEAVLLELKQNWENKLQSSKAIDPVTDPAEASLQNKLQQRSSLPSKAGQQASSTATANNSTPQQAASQAKQPSQTPATAPNAATGAAATSAAAPAATTVRMVPVQITVPPQAGVTGHTAAKSITVHVPAHALQGGTAGAQLQTILSSPAVTAALSLPVEMATTVLQQHINNALQSTAGRSQSRTDNGGVTQLDGPGDSSDDDDDVDDDDDDDVEEEDDHDDEEIDADNEENADEEPLNSEDDVTDDDPSVLFETDNVVVCQYDKITRSRNRWKFHLKDGIMNINGRDYVFQKANGDAEW